MTTQNPGNAMPPDPAEQVRLLTIRTDEAERAVSEQRTRADAAVREVEGLRAELVTARERITALNAQISAGTAAVETAAVMEQRRRADAVEQELAQVRAQQPELVRRRAGLVAKAQAVLPTLRADGLSDREIIVQALRHLAPKEPTGPEVSEDYLRRRLDALIDDRAAYGASLSRASQTLAPRAPQSQNNQARADELPWADRWKGGLGEYSTNARKD